MPLFLIFGIVGLLMFFGRVLSQVVYSYRTRQEQIEKEATARARARQ